MSNVDNKNTDDLIGQLCEGLESGKPRCPYRSVSIWFILSTLYVVGIVHFSGIQVDFNEKLSSANFIFEMGMALAVLISSALASSWLCFPDNLQRGWMKIIAVTLFASFLFWIVAHSFEEGGSISKAFFMPSCSRGLLVEALPFVALIIMTMRGNTTQPYWAMTMNVMAVSALGWIGLRLTCAMYDSMFYGFIHYLLPFSILGVAFGFFARKLFKW